MAPEMTTRLILGSFYVPGGLYVKGFKSLDEAKQFRKEHGGMVLDSHKKSKTKALYGQRMREAGLDRTLYPYAVEFTG